MAHFAELDDQNTVLQVIVIHNNELLDNGVESEAKGIAFCQSLFPGTTWVQTSYNTYGGVHRLGGTPMRKNYAGIGYTYDSVRDAFIPPKPFKFWSLDEETCLWTPPTPYPDDGNRYTWDDSTVSWVPIPL